MTGKQIQSIRKTLGESTTEFAERFFVSQRTVESWEQGDRNPAPLILDMLAKLRNSKTFKKFKNRS